MSSQPQAALYPLDAIRMYDFLDAEINPVRAKLYNRADQRDLTKYYFLHTFLMVSGDQQIIMSFKGQTGSGKSYGGLSTALFICSITGAELMPEWVFNLNIGTFENGYVDGNIDDQNRLLEAFRDGEIAIAFNRTQLKRSISRKVSAGKFIGSVFILDEKPQATQVGKGARREKWQIHDIQTEMRSLRASFIRISTSLEEGEEPQFVIEALRQFDKKNNKSRCYLYNVQDGKVDTFPTGYVWFPIPPKRVRNVYEFLKKYNQFSKLEGRPLGRFEDYKRDAIKIVKTERWQKTTRRKMKKTLINEAYEGQYTREELDMIFEYALEYEKEIKKQLAELSRVEFDEDFLADKEEICEGESIGLPGSDDAYTSANATPSSVIKNVKPKNKQEFVTIIDAELGKIKVPRGVEVRVCTGFKSVGGKLEPVYEMKKF